MSSVTAEKLRDQGATVASDLRELGRLTNDAAREKLDQARQVASRMVDRGRQKVGEQREQLESYVRERPLNAVLIAAGVGILLGYVYGRRR
jgi:ElaB/YqjD/DUF883 family membrane-anchored ribosome-binding protein